MSIDREPFEIYALGKDPGGYEVSLEALGNIPDPRPVVVHGAWPVLTIRERRVLELLGGWAGQTKRTQREVSREVELSPSTISRTVKSALEKLGYPPST